MRLARVFPQKCIRRINADSAETIINQLVQVLVEAGRFKPTQKGNVVKAILERERLGTTGIGEGVAIPHAKLKFVKEFHGAFAALEHGVNWKATDGNPVRFVFLFISPDDRPGEHQNLIKSIIRFIRLPHFLTFLDKAKTPKEIFELVKEGEES